MSVRFVLFRLGGVATRAELVAATSRREVDRAVKDGTIVRLARGRYGAAEIDEARATAHEMHGVLCLESAALQHGWQVKEVPGQPQVSFPKKRKVPEERAARVELHRLHLTEDDHRRGVTTPDRTLIDCLRWLPTDRALAVADQALRSGVRRRHLEDLVGDLQGPGSATARAVAAQADGRAANPFESVLRSIALTVPGLAVVPQVRLDPPDPAGRDGRRVQPDLVDVRLKIVLEADSFEWHGKRPALVSDARRYNRLSADGWLVLRFTWEDVMYDPEGVRAVIAAAVAERTQGDNASSRPARGSLPEAVGSV